MAEIRGRKNERNRDREEGMRKGNHKKGMKAERAEVRKGQSRRAKKKIKEGRKDEITNENKGRMTEGKEVIEGTKYKKTGKMTKR